LNRAQQYKKFNGMIALTIQYALMEGIPLRMGEAHRTLDQARLNVKKGVSKTLNSKHRYSLAQDFWLHKPYKGRPGKDIDWFKEKKAMYKKLGKFWKFLGGRWGALKKDGGDFNRLNDPYHFEWSERPA